MTRQCITRLSVNSYTGLPMSNLAGRIPSRENLRARLAEIAFREAAILAEVPSWRRMHR
jgi:hypothetical protein